MSKDKFSFSRSLIFRSEIMADQNHDKSSSKKSKDKPAAAAVTTAATDVPDGNSTRSENNNVNRKDSFMFKAIYKNFSF